jgi:hypothetical protein
LCDNLEYDNAYGLLELLSQQAEVRRYKDSLEPRLLLPTGSNPIVPELPKAQSLRDDINGYSHKLGHS